MKKEENIFSSSKDDIQLYLTEKNQNYYLQLIKDGKFSKIQELWNSIDRNTFIVKELQIIF
jgi:hypothetical protein